jgi:hypothetical protein
VDLLDVKLACPMGLYQLDDVLKGCRPVKAMLKGFTNQHTRRCMISILTSMELCEQLVALLPGNTPH